MDIKNIYLIVIIIFSFISLDKTNEINKLQDNLSNACQDLDQFIDTSFHRECSKVYYPKK